MPESDILDKTSQYETDSKITKIEYHSYTSYTTLFNNNHEIRILIQQIDVYPYLHESFISLEGLIDDATKVKLIKNGYSYLFEQIRLEINGIEVDSTRVLEITSSLKGYLSGTPDNYNCLKMLAEILKTQHNRKMAKANLVLAFHCNIGKIILKKIVWMVPHITVDDEKRLKFLKLIEKEKSLFIPFRFFENFEYPELGTTKKVVWNLKTSSKLEKPRFIIIGLQKGRTILLTKDCSIFDHCNLTNVKVFLNSMAYPYNNLNLNFTKKSYYEKDIRNPILSPSTFLANVLIIVIDTSKQNTATASAVDVQLEIEASESLAGVTAYCLLIHDRIVEYVPFTRESVTEVQAIQTFSIRKSTLIKMWKIRKNIEDDEDLLMLGAGPTLQKRNEHGVNKLLMNLQDDDVGLNGELRSSFKNFLRMSSHDFENQTNLLVQQLKKNNNWRCPISVTERLSLTLRFLATGDSYHSLMYQFRISTQSISLIVPEVCEAIINALSGYIKLVGSRQKLMIINLYKTKMLQQPKLTIKEVVKIISKELGIGQRTAQLTIAEYKNEKTVRSPDKTKIRATFKEKIDDFERDAIRRKVHEFWFRKQLPTLDKILIAVNEDPDLNTYKRSTLHLIVRDLNFVYVKRGRNSALIEREDIVLWRTKYIEDIRKYRSQGRTIYYLDETWVNAEEGFVDGGLLVFESKKGSADYHEEMNGDVFFDWLKGVIPLLKDNSVIVMDNAPYHSTKSEKCPTLGWKKGEIENWLEEKGE
ncbi:hypothetical protein QTP88_021104 [Uroleucon formosanum]